MTSRPGGSPHGLNLVPFAETGKVLQAVGRSNSPLHHPFLGYLLWNVGGNVLVFMPVGFFLAGAFQHRGRLGALWRAVTIGCLFSLTIELVQLALPTRATDVDDIIFNTLGAGLGALVFLPVLRRRQRARLTG